MRIAKFACVAAAAGLLASGIAGSVMAETAAEKRKAFMKGLGADMKAMGAVAKGEAEFSPETVQHARNVVAHSKELTNQFPEGSGGAKTRAKDEIWVNWSSFEEKAGALAAAAPQLVNAAQSNERAQLGAALQQVGKTCGGCHDSFRKPET